MQVRMQEQVPQFVRNGMRKNVSLRCADTVCRIVGNLRDPGIKNAGMISLAGQRQSASECGTAPTSRGVLVDHHGKGSRGYRTAALALGIGDTGVEPEDVQAGSPEHSADDFPRARDCLLRCAGGIGRT